VETNRHVTGTALETLVIGSNILVKESRVINLALLHARNHGFGAEVSQQGVIELDVTFRIRSGDAVILQ
jgi:hypothetical protein